MLSSVKTTYWYEKSSIYEKYKPFVRLYSKYIKNKKIREHIDGDGYRLKIELNNRKDYKEMKQRIKCYEQNKLGIVKAKYSIFRDANTGDYFRRNVYKEFDQKIIEEMKDISNLE